MPQPRLIAVGIAGQLSLANQSDLFGRWSEPDLDTLARDFVLPVGTWVSEERVYQPG